MQKTILVDRQTTMHIPMWIVISGLVLGDVEYELSRLDCPVKFSNCILGCTFAINKY